MTALMHYTSDPLEFDPSRTYEQREPYSYRKPEGFWVSVLGEDDWPSWCTAEEFCPDSLRVAHRVTLSADASIIKIDTVARMLQFHESFSTETDYERSNSRLYPRPKWPIDWREVSQRYDGIIIAPYQWALRLDLMWYYGWDCASGCIWNLSAIASVELAQAVSP